MGQNKPRPAEINYKQFRDLTVYIQLFREKYGNKNYYTLTYSTPDHILQSVQYLFTVELNSDPRMKLSEISL